MKKQTPVLSCELSPANGVRTGLTVADLKQSLLDNLFWQDPFLVLADYPKRSNWHRAKKF